MSETASSLQIRRAEESDIPELEAFFRRNYPERHLLSDMEAWRWWFLRNPQGKEKIPFFVLEAEGIIHGGIGYLPVALKINDRVEAGGHPVKHFVDPAYKGLPALRLMRVCLSECPIAFFSNLSEDAVRLAKANGFVDLSQYLKHYYLPLRAKAADHKERKYTRIARGMIFHVMRILQMVFMRTYCRVSRGRWRVEIGTQLPQLGDDWSNFTAGGRYRVIKSPKYLHWRYEQSPLLNCVYFSMHNNQDIAALAVVHMNHDNKQAVILDIIQAQADFPRMLCLLAAVASHCRSSGMLVLTTTMIHPDIGKVLRLLGFGCTTSNNRFMVYAGDKALKEELTDPKKWEFFLGDTDVY